MHFLDKEKLSCLGNFYKLCFLSVIVQNMFILIFCTILGKQQWFICPWNMNGNCEVFIYMWYYYVGVM